MSKAHRHGAALQAPAEVAAGESPAPPSVSAKAKRNTAVKSRRSSGAIRATLRALRLVAGATIVLGIAFAVAWGSYRYALSSSRFALEELQLSGARRVGPARIEELSGIASGTNLFSIDTQTAEQQILQDPWVAEATVTRRLPNTLEIQLVEHQPAAIAVIGDGLFLVTRDGQPFKRLVFGDPHQLPMITGIEPEDLAADREAQVRRLAEAQEILRQYARLSLSKVHPPQELHLDATGEVVLTVGSRGIQLHLGKTAWRKRLLMAARVFAKLGSQGTPGTVFLDNEAHPERVVVRMR